MVFLAGIWTEPTRRSKRWHLIQKTVGFPLLRCCFRAPMSVEPWPPTMRRSMDPFHDVQKLFYEINEYTLINVSSPIEGAEMLEMGKQIHSLVWKAGFLLVTSVCNALISMYARSGQTHDARWVFDEMVHQDSVSWNSLISGYSQHHLSNQAIELFSRMQNSLLQPNEYSLASILEVLSNLNSLKLAMQMHLLMLKLGFILTDSVLCRLITAYGKCNGIDKSKSIFSEIDRELMITVDAIPTSLDVDIITFSTFLKSCGALSDLHQGKSVRLLAIKSAISEDKFIESAVIDVYGKCGSLEDAAKVFLNAAGDSLVAWNAIIMGYAQIGCYSKAYDLFQQNT
ncbi:Pentatricopeptide repeat-containing protein [Cynara cardunculus var. scolymus]|uniref:Pentatricopeptide repeat-containing protein n=1 Tax=Cynara cardunculus var. scolymus TaxID=59895 RepID=A0A103XR57_CYNCS|nr:Pentatricopeptide repeat-containing protein [Cynara cardunculus var. scolymus]